MIRRVAIAALSMLAVVACESPGLREGSVVAAVTTEDRVLVGELTCDGDRMPARERAIIWWSTGNRSDPLEKLWEGRLKVSTASLPSSGVDLFSTYEYVAGPLGAVDSLAQITDGEEISVVLQFSGATGLSLSKARATPGAYFHKGVSGTFDELQRAFCAPSGTAST